MTEQDLDTLEALAKAATPGPWVVDSSRHHSRNQQVNSADVQRTDIGTTVATLTITAWKQNRRDARPDARFMAAANPSTVLSLISALRERDARVRVDGETSDGYHTFNELYDYRKALHALLVNEWARLGLYDVHKSWHHSDGEPCFGGGWFIVVAELPEGQVSNHYKAADWALFQVPERERGNTYDGHTPATALGRLLARAALTTKGPTDGR